MTGPSAGATNPTTAAAAAADAPDENPTEASSNDVRVVPAPSPYDLTSLSSALEGATTSTANGPTVDDNDNDAAKGAPIVGAPRPFKIAMLSWESLHSVAVGGVAPHVTELAAGLERRGHEVHVYVRTGVDQPSYERIDGVHVHRIAFTLSDDFVTEVNNMCNAMVHFLLETERFMNRTFDIVHCHDWLTAAALVNIKNNHGWSHKCVFTVHSTEYGRCGNNVFGGQSARIRDLEQQAVSTADRCIAVSGVLCDEVKQHYSFDWDRLRCVYNGINCLRYDGELWDPAQVRALYGVGPMDPMVLFVGRMAVQKGPDILINAIPAVLGCRPDAKFILVGDGYMKEDLVRRAHELGVAASVSFPGTMSGQPLVDLFKATDVVAIPSRNEPFGIVTLEAWASTKPVVVTKSGGPREFVWHDNDGFLVDTTSDGMAWGICNAFTNFDHMRYMGERGRVKAAFQFSWDRIAESTNNIYDEIVPPSDDNAGDQHGATTTTTNVTNSISAPGATSTKSTTHDPAVATVNNSPLDPAPTEHKPRGANAAMQQRQQQKQVQQAQRDLHQQQTQGDADPVATQKRPEQNKHHADAVAV